MDIIAVDPKLFITCRLCLDEMGQYQIVPSVKQQIKYCFDIEVEPFDGLPQLICVKCKDILSNYSTTKKRFNEKQINLRNNILLKNETKAVPQQDTVSSTQSQHDAQPPLDEQLNKDKIKAETNIVINKTLGLKEKLGSSNNSDTDSSYSGKKLNKRQKTEKRQITWETGYKKLIICRLCNSSYATMRALKNHYHIHRPLINKYKYILNQYCSITLTKLDNKPNITGLSNMVVHNDSKIIHSSDCYYTLYAKEVAGNSIAPNNSVPSNLIDSDSTDEEHIFMKRKARKRRLISRSSNDTVVLDTGCNNVTPGKESKQDHNESELSKTNDQCINIDDTTDSEGENKNMSSRNLNPKKIMAAKLEDFKNIQDIIDSCTAAYRLKKDSSKTIKPNKLDSHLKHIILSIGKKTISSKQSINCTGLLRYLEHKDLDILWIPRTHHSIFVTTKLKSSKNNDSGWFNIFTNPKQDSGCVNIIDNPKSDCRWVSVDDNPENNSGCIGVLDNPKNNSGGVSNPINDKFASDVVNDDSEYKTLSSNEPSQIEQGKNITVENMNNENETARAHNADDVIMYTASCTDTKNKLLNANPVRNPKKLPKKVNQSTSTIPENSLFINKDDKGLSMPIITSTTSLAEFPESDDSCDIQISTNTTSEVPTQNIPRIKVKPVSELMSQQGLNNLIKEQAISATNNNLLIAGGQVTFPKQNHMNIYVPTILPCLVSTKSSQVAQEPFLNVPTPYQISFSNNTNAVVNNPKKTDHLILDTVELPNTKTNSPFAYLKSLLQIHNLILMNPTDKLPKSFVCLIQFKVVFTQETIEKPVVLCISLYGCNNMFCLKVKDLDVYKISANWQWEILKVYTGDIVNKILQNAQKVSQEMYENTNNFLCLLKSINLKK